jgi:hypothetical protein
MKRRLQIGRQVQRDPCCLRSAWSGFRGDTKLYTQLLAGVFELEDRLLHKKDGLALWAAVEAELEALSNNALVLVLELLL